MLPTLGRRALAEFLGTMTLIIAAIGSCILPVQVFHLDAGLAVLMNAMAVAFVLFAVIEAFGPVSGAHFNPAVTVAMVVSEKMRKKDAAVYIGAQFSGGFVGLLLTHLMYYDTVQQLLVVSENTKGPFVVITEALAAFLLLAVIYGCVRGRSKMTSLSVGLLVGGLLITTSSTMFANPVVTFCRMFTYAFCGIAPSSGVLFMIAEFSGALVAVAAMSYLYPKKLVEKCNPYDCPPRPVEFT